MKKYNFHNFAECLEHIADYHEFDKWETLSYKEIDSDGIYEVNFMSDDECFLFSKTIIENLEDGSCYIAIGVSEIIKRFNSLSESGKRQFLAEITGFFKALDKFQLLEESLKEAEKK